MSHPFDEQCIEFNHRAYISSPLFVEVSHAIHPHTHLVLTLASFLTFHCLFYFTPSTFQFVSSLPWPVPTQRRDRKCQQMLKYAKTCPKHNRTNCPTDPLTRTKQLQGLKHSRYRVVNS